MCNAARTGRLNSIVRASRTGLLSRTWTNTPSATTFRCAHRTWRAAGVAAHRCVEGV